MNDNNLKNFDGLADYIIENLNKENFNEGSMRITFSSMNKTDEMPFLIELKDHYEETIKKIIQEKKQEFNDALKKAKENSSDHIYILFQIFNFNQYIVLYKYFAENDIVVKTKFQNMTLNNFIQIFD